MAGVAALDFDEAEVFACFHDKIRVYDFSPQDLM
jgi:sigma54-dependent transcription regulator